MQVEDTMNKVPNRLVQSAYKQANQWLKVNSMD